jgi:hypothetical protein
MHPGAQLGWQGRKYTEVLQDLGIMARRPQGGRFWCPDDQHGC